MKPGLRKALRIAGFTAAGVVLLAAMGLGWFYARLRASRPQLDGTAAITSLTAPVTVTRDDLGVPTIRGASRADVTRALGFLHAQDRFFQMDLMRRDAAGELAELFGERALSRDKARRLHGFRALARQVADRADPGERALIEAYAAGVNAGLAALGNRPFEYDVTRTTPRRWEPEDCILVFYAMWLDLGDSRGSYERTLMTLRDFYGPEAVAFFAPLQTPDDAALDGSTAPLAPIPGPRVIDLRPAKVSLRSDAGALPSALAAVGRRETVDDTFPFAPRDPDIVLGSNAFALAGKHTATGAGLLGLDMHLSLNLPNTWYRASLEYDGRRITGTTLPGAPALVTGSNGKVAWGFTVSYTDIGDLVVLEPVAGLTGWYIVPGGESKKVETRTEVIAIKGGKPVTFEAPWTIWGPVVGKNEKGRSLAYRSVMHDPTAVNFRLLEIERAATVADAVKVVHEAALPSLNTVLADAAGDIAWTIGGRLPKRLNYDGRLPVPMAYGDRRWEGLLPPDEVPVVASNHAAIPQALPAPDGRIWSANHRQVGGEALAKLGDGGYARPYRARQIRDALQTLEKATPADLLKIQLDDRALLLARWQKLLLATLTPEVVNAKSGRAELRAFAEKWEGRASVEAVSYPVVKRFRLAVHRRIYPAIFAAALEAEPNFDWERLNLEPATWALLEQKPAHLLNPACPSWEAVLVAAADDVIAQFAKSKAGPMGTRWGRLNRSQIRHPFGAMLPGWLTGWLNIPDTEVPGDNDMPRIQSPRNGASERFAVSPGREAEGYFHMPGGQSGHPLSPYYRAGHEAWVRGEPTPFLPGPTRHTLQLTP